MTEICLKKDLWPLSGCFRNVRKKDLGPLNGFSTAFEIFDRNAKFLTSPSKFLTIDFEILGFGHRNFDPPDQISTSDGPRHRQNRPKSVPPSPESPQIGPVADQNDKIRCSCRQWALPTSVSSLITQNSLLRPSRRFCRSSRSSHRFRSPSFRFRRFSHRSRRSPHCHKRSSNKFRHHVFGFLQNGQIVLYIFVFDLTFGF